MAGAAQAGTSATRFKASGDLVSRLGDLTREAFRRGREGLTALRASGKLLAFAEVPLLRFAAGVGANAKAPQGKPQRAESTWTEFCEGIVRYSHVIVGDREMDKRLFSAYILAGELSEAGRSSANHGLPPSGFTRVGQEEVRGASLGGLGRGGPGGPGRTALGRGGFGGPGPRESGDADRSDAALSSITMLVLDCDMPAPTAGVCRALRELSIAHCLAPTWSATVERPKWRLFVPIAPIPTDPSAMGRVRARLRYAWIAGLVAELGGLPRECPDCVGRGAGGSGAALVGGACAGCSGTGDFSFDLTCWNYSRLHFLGGRRSADVSMLGREVRWSKGLAVDVEAWLAGSEWSSFWDATIPVVEPELAGEVGGRAGGALGGLGGLGEFGGGLGGDDEDVTCEAHPDQALSYAMLRCRVPLYERVRRACSYVGSPSFPPSVSGSRGHDALMRAASVVCSGFLVPIGSARSGRERAGAEVGADSAWAERVLQVAFNPRCSPPWQLRDLARKVRQVRASASQAPGALLGAAGVAGHGAGAGLRSYIVDGQLCSSSGRPHGVADADVLELFRDAARSCSLDPYDPGEVPAGFRVVMGPAMGRR